ncbi:TetR/AcrR family transcriptional regulator [Rhodococcus spongiicola]|uniref:TetR/AcrR family transcriptional regulator n=1 Tax=Rhodococcus spongiicola TaxID=2487352 RepID=A0A3S3AQL2_9NOCA|nr:TetR/AcrR family transcriptional regulator [Rhodococcus spongiicola]RVW06086.1 TetR/AcrR family transcriptional regulator [Rhodococcus spongiicola]
MDGVKRTRLSPEERRAQLIGLGVRMLADRPLEQISVEDIADQAGVSGGLLFHYFASKHDFHLAIVRHTSEEMLAATAPNPDLEPLEILRDATASYVNYVSENRGTYLPLLRGTASSDPDMREVCEETRTEMVRRVVEHLPSLGIEPTSRTELPVRGWIAFVEETTISWLHRPQLSRDELIDLHVAALTSVTDSVESARALSG